MKLPASTLREVLTYAVAIAVGAVFLYAGIDKVRDPLHFSDSINAFGILPHTVIDGLAVALPLYEIISAGLILLPATRRLGSLALLLASVMFFFALLSALLRGLTLDCGCFGGGAPSRPRMWAELGLDALLVGGTAFIYLRALLEPTRALGAET